jgi:hypothetical protein
MVAMTFPFFSFLSIQPPPDTVHTGGFWADFADLAVLASMEGFLSSPYSRRLTRFTL